MSVIDKFMTLMMEREEDGCTTPIIQHGNDTFIFIKCNNLYRILFMFFYKIIITTSVALKSVGTRAQMRIKTEPFIIFKSRGCARICESDFSCLVILIVLET